MIIQIGFTRAQLQTMLNALNFHDRCPASKIRSVSPILQHDFPGVTEGLNNEPVEVIITNLDILKERQSENPSPLQVPARLPE